MRKTVGGRALRRSLVRAAAVAVVAASAGACSTIPHWINPTTWIGGGSSSSTTQQASDQQPASQQQTTDQGTQGNGAYPQVADIPARPQASSPGEQQQVADALVADRAGAQYSADALRGGTEAAAAPPPPVAPTSEELARLDESTPAQTASAAPPPAAMPAPAAEEPSPAPTEPVAVAPVPAAPAPTVVASLGGEPAVPSVHAISGAALAQAGGVAGAQPGVPSDAMLGFKPSTAPALDPSVAQFVPPPIIARYRATQNAAGEIMPPPSGPVIAGVSSTVVPASYAPGAPAVPGAGGGGSVFVNLDAVSSAGVARTSATDGVLGTAAWRTPGRVPTAVVFFPGGGAGLDAAGQAQVRAAVDAYRARGGQGYVRVVGHSSSRTANMPLAKHLEVIFKESQARANAVAQALIKDGIPANAVIVEAVGDTQPVYYESMPQGEEGNRRTEIFIEG